MNIKESKEKMIRGIALFSEGLIGYIGSLPETAGISVSSPTVTPADDDLSTCNLVEAAKMIGMSRSKIDRLCDAGEIEYIKDPNSQYRRVRINSLRRWIRSRTTQIQEKGKEKVNG